MFSGFQASGYQNNAYQIVSGGTPVPIQNGGSFWATPVKSRKKVERDLKINQEKILEKTRLLAEEDRRLAELKRVEIKESRAYRNVTEALRKEILLLGQEQAYLRALLEFHRTDEDDLLFIFMGLLN